jgi:hypothetical protein
MVDKVTNSDLLAEILKALYTIAERRTSRQFALGTIESTLRTLESKYSFLKTVCLEKGSSAEDGVNIANPTNINSAQPEKIRDAIESIVRKLYAHLEPDEGFYFITELKEYLEEKVVKAVTHYDVDLDEIQWHQHDLYQREKRKYAQDAHEREEKRQKKVNLLGYTWDQVGSWKHEPDSPYCVLYDKGGKVLDRLNLNNIIKSYIERLSGYTNVDPWEYRQEIEIYEKDYELLELMYEQDMDIETAAHLLHLSEEEINEMIRKLSRIDMVHFTSSDTVELTDTGIDYVSKSEKRKEQVHPKKKIGRY